MFCYITACQLYTIDETRADEKNFRCNYLCVVEFNSRLTISILRHEIGKREWKRFVFIPFFHLIAPFFSVCPYHVLLLSISQLPSTLFTSMTINFTGLCKILLFFHFRSVKPPLWSYSHKIQTSTIISRLKSCKQRLPCFPRAAVFYFV